MPEPSHQQDYKADSGWGGGGGEEDGMCPVGGLWQTPWPGSGNTTDRR